MGQEERSANSVSRRTMLKRIGAAGAIAWVTPVISSLTTPAYAATSGLCAHGYTCGGELLSCDGESCNCFSTAGGPACTGGATSFCDAFQSCESEACPSGTACVIDSCCPNPVCLPLCGQTSGLRTGAAPLSGSGMTPSGRRS
jgi:hypothetical protein